MAKLAKGGGSHGIQPVGTPPKPVQQRPTPPPAAQAPLSPEKFVQPNAPRLNPPRNLPPKRTVRQSTPTRANQQQSGRRINPNATASRRPPKPSESPESFARLRINGVLETDAQFRERLHIPAHVSLDREYEARERWAEWLVNNPNRPTGEPQPFVDPRPRPRPHPRPIPRIFPKKKKKFQAGKKPRRPFKMGVPRKERIRLLKEKAEQAKNPKPAPWDPRHGENFPRPPQNFEPDWFRNPRVRQRKGNPFGLDR